MIITSFSVFKVHLLNLTIIWPSRRHQA